MRSSDLKEHIIDTQCLDTILEDLGCGHITRHDGYYTCSNHDGDNRHAIVVYLNENLTTINYTRDIAKTKRTTDLFDLVMFCKDCSFPEALKYVQGLLGLDFYEEKEEVCESLQILKMLKEMNSGSDDAEETPLKPISEKILEYYVPWGNVMFQDDGISLTTQKEWEIGFDGFSNSITIPIRDELGTLIAVKARRFKYTQDIPMEKRRFSDELEDGESKYFFLEPGAKSQVLYGLHKNNKFIQSQGIVYVGESEKFVLQLYEMGFYGVSTGGTKISKRQVEMLTRLGVKICLCFDKDVDEDTLDSIANMFMDGVPVFALIDKDNALNEKQSPSDDTDKWMYMIKNHIYQIK